MDSCYITPSNSSKMLDVELQQWGTVTCNEEWKVQGYAPFHRVYYIHSGKATCRIEDMDYPLKVGHLYLFPINAIYEVVHDSANPLRCTYMHLYIMPLLCNTFEEIKLEESSLLLKGIEMLQLLIEDDTRYSTIQYQAIVLVDLMSRYIQYEFLGSDAILKAVALIKKQYDKSITNGTIARQLGYNTNYFIGLFSEFMGITPKQYLAKYRIRMAIKDIKNGLSISQVAKNVGYLDSKAFSRFFKQHVGIAPSEYLNYYKVELQA